MTKTHVTETTECNVLLTCETCDKDFGYCSDDIQMEHSFQCIDCAEKEDE